MTYLDLLIWGTISCHYPRVYPSGRPLMLQKSILHFHDTLLLFARLSMTNILIWPHSVYNPSQSCHVAHHNRIVMDEWRKEEGSSDTHSSDSNASSNSGSVYRGSMHLAAEKMLMSISSTLSSASSSVPCQNRARDSRCSTVATNVRRQNGWFPTSANYTRRLALSFQAQISPATNRHLVPSWDGVR